MRTVILLFFLLVNAHGLLELQLTQGVIKKTPVGLVYDNNNQVLQKIVATVKQDFLVTTEFSTINFEQTKAAELLRGDNHIIVNFPDYVVTFFLEHNSDQLILQVSLYDAFASNKLIVTKKYMVKKDQLEKLAHHVSDLLYLNITKVPGVFSTKVAYVKRSVTKQKTLYYELVVADIYGKNEQLLLSSVEPIASLSWSPTGKQLAYVSFEKHRSEIYKIDIATGNRELITSFAGLNSAPKFSPDGNSIALVLSKHGEPNIYVYNIMQKSLRRLTNSKSIDTEPEWSLDGKFIYFTSDRGKGVQIYQLDIASLDIKQISKQGRYNSSPQIIPYSNKLLMLHKNDFGFNLAVQNLHTNVVEVKTNNGYIQNPSIAPNGKMVLFVRGDGNKKMLTMMPLTTGKQVKLKISGRDIIKPAWGPIT